VAALNVQAFMEKVAEEPESASYEGGPQKLARKERQAKGD